MKELEPLLNAIGDYLDQFKEDKKERIKQIDEIKEFLVYEERLMGLTKEELDYAGNIPLPEIDKERMKKMNPKQKDEYLKGLARIAYMRQCEWRTTWWDYLKGKTDIKPFISKSKDTKLIL